jgi:hypothetical protein
MIATLLRGQWRSYQSGFSIIVEIERGATI